MCLQPIRLSKTNIMPNALVEAYKLKKELKNIEPIASPKKIQTNGPYQWNSPKRFEHSQAAVLARQQIPPKVTLSSDIPRFFQLLLVFIY